MKNEEPRNDRRASALSLRSRPLSHSQFSILRSSFIIRASIVPLCFVLFLTGCGKTGDVAGVVTLNGKPLTSGNVLMMGQDGLPHYGKVQPDGNYEIKDVPLGEAMIAVVSPNPEIIRQHLADAPAEVQAGLPNPDGWLPIPQKYCDAYLSGLRFDVQPGPNTFDIQLTGPVEDHRTTGRRARR